MLKDRMEFEKNLIEIIQTTKLKTKKKLVNEIKLDLAKNYEILDAQGWINDPKNRLSEVDLRKLLLFGEQVFLKTLKMDIDNESINPKYFFTEQEIKEARAFSGITELKQNELDYPITFANAQVVGTNAYMVVMNIKEIKQLLENNLIYYNFETQREAKFIKRKDKIVIEPTLNKKSIKEMTELLLTDRLVPTVLTFNAEIRTTSDPSGEELLYDAKKAELTITSNSRVSITDGFHRITAARNALQINPDLEFNFAVLITNYSTKKAQEFMAQISKNNPVSKTRIQELEANRFSDLIVKQLKEESELKGRVSQTNRLHSLNRELVSYNNLADSIDEQFKIDTKIQALDIGDFLVKCIDYLIGFFPNEFIHNVEEVRKESLINDNNIFVGYIVIFRRLWESKINPREIVNIIKNIDFSRNNQLWKELGIVNEQGHITDTNKARKAIREYFNNIEIKDRVMGNE